MFDFLKSQRYWYVVADGAPIVVQKKISYNDFVTFLPFAHNQVYISGKYIIFRVQTNLLVDTLWTF